jgi:hypothetical protein
MKSVQREIIDALFVVVLVVLLHLGLEELGSKLDYSHWSLICGLIALTLARLRRVSLYAPC